MNRSALVLVLAGSVALAACATKSDTHGASASAVAEAPPPTASSSAVPLPPPPPPPTSASFTLHAEARDQPNFTIDKVTIDPKETTLEVTFENTAPRQRWIAVHPKGEELAMFLEAGGKKYAFLRSANVAEHPKKDFLAPKQKKSFTLVFEPLPIATTSFDLFEGEKSRAAPAVKGTVWAFLGVQLSGPK